MKRRVMDRHIIKRLPGGLHANNYIGKDEMKNRIAGCKKRLTKKVILIRDRTTGPQSVAPWETNRERLLPVFIF